MNPLLKEIFALAADVVERGRAKSVTVGTAESCTGGLIGGALTAIAGSSAVYQGGVVSYSNALKTALLGVSESALSEHGAVSEEVASAMAMGARTRLGVDFALAVTGIAGPGGGSEAKPVGTVWIALARPGGVSAKRMDYGDIGRNRVRDETVRDGLKMLADALA